jgi:hypothetical protein
LVDVIITDKGKKLLENLDKKQEEMDQLQKFQKKKLIFSAICWIR